MADDAWSDFLVSLESRDRETVNLAALRLLDEHARLGLRWLAVGKVLDHNGEIESSLRAIELAFADTQGGLQAGLALASGMLQAGRPRAAKSLLEVNFSNNANAQVAATHLLAVCDLQLGLFNSARSRLEQTVEFAPDNGAAWLQLALLPKHEDAKLLDRLMAIDDAAMGPGARAPVLHARGSVLERLGEFDRAFAMNRKAANVSASVRPYDEAADRAEAEAVLGAADSAIASWELASDEGSDGPIFVGGLPRSGTTLIEQTLVAHSEVGGGAETRFGDILTREIGGRTPDAMTNYLASGKSGGEAVGLHRRLGAERFGPGRYVDKSLNFGRMSLIYAAIAPRQPIIWMVRNPADLAWSNFRTYFARGAEWSYSFETMAEHFVLEDILQAQCEIRFGKRMLVIELENHIADSDRSTENLLDHCGLVQQPGPFAPHLGDRSVSSASFAQVRRPINRDGIGIAKPYNRYFGPFFDTYERARKKAGLTPLAG